MIAHCNIFRTAHESNTYECIITKNFFWLTKIPQEARECNIISKAKVVDVLQVWYKVKGGRRSLKVPDIVVKVEGVVVDGGDSDLVQ